MFIYSLDRGKYQQPFIDFLEDCGFDNYGQPMKDYLEKYVKSEYGTSYIARDTNTPVETVLNEGRFSHTDDSEDRDNGEYWYYRGNFYYIYWDWEDKYQKDYNKYLDCSFVYEDALNQWLKENKYKSVNDIPIGNIIPAEIEALKVDEPNTNDYKRIQRIMLVIPQKVHNYYFDNGVFLVRPYYWGDAENIIDKPNFIYYPDGFEMKVYKYFIRGNETNKKITLKKFNEMLNKCRESLKEK